MKKKTKSAIATIIVLSGFFVFGYIIVKRLFIEPITEIFKDNPVTFVNVLAVVFAYIMLFFLGWLMYRLFSWAFRNF